MAPRIDKPSGVFFPAISTSSKEMAIELASADRTWPKISSPRLTFTPLGSVTEVNALAFTGSPTLADLAVMLVRSSACTNRPDGCPKNAAGKQNPATTANTNRFKTSSYLPPGGFDSASFAYRSVSSFAFSINPCRRYTCANMKWIGASAGASSTACSNSARAFSN
jgi:hypothetical protein